MARVSAVVSTQALCGPDAKESRNEEGSMMRILLVGYDPEAVDYSDPALPPGMSAEKIRAGITLALKQVSGCPPLRAATWAVATLGSDRTGASPPRRAPQRHRGGVLEDHSCGH